MRDDTLMAGSDSNLEFEEGMNEWIGKRLEFEVMLCVLLNGLLENT